MDLRRIPAVPPAAERQDRPPEYYLPMQQVTRELAFSPSSWTRERREETTRLFDGLAPEWHTRGGEERLAPTRDALRRGEIRPGGVALEVGSGIGLQSGVILEHFDRVVSVELSAEMLSLAPRRERLGLLRADASQLPLAPATVDAVVCVNAFLFPEEYSRVLTPSGAVVFVSTSGERTPIYLPPDDVVAALDGPLGPVRAITSSVGWSTWTVVLRCGEAGA